MNGDKVVNCFLHALLIVFFFVHFDTHWNTCFQSFYLEGNSYYIHDKGLKVLGVRYCMYKLSLSFSGKTCIS